MLNCNPFLNYDDFDYLEKARLEELYNYEMLYTPKEDTIDSITKLTQIICETPFCLVSLLDRTKQWFKSSQGLNADSTDREISFCNYAIKQEYIFEVKDSLEDPRFRNNPLVTGYPYIRYYAGMPLKSPNGFNIGTLCVIDTKPRELREDQRIALETLAKQVILQFEMKKVLKDLKIANEKSMKLSLVKDEFLSNMSHELRTPLNAIYGFTEIMQNSVKDTKQKEYLDIIKSSVEILISIINDILDFSKIELGKLAIERKPFDLKKTLKEIFELLKQKATEKNLHLYLRIGRNVPNSIIGDKVRLNQILVNLIGNAIKFTNIGKVEIFVRRVSNKLKKKINDNQKENEIKLINREEICIITKAGSKSSLKNDDYPEKNINRETNNISELEFIVKDSGIGIKEEKLNKIFERFEQASSDITRKYGGSGLGLSISKNLVELQGGEIKVESIFEKGSKFKFCIAYEYIKEEPNNKTIDLYKNEEFIDNENNNFTTFDDSIIFETNKFENYNNKVNKNSNENNSDKKGKEHINKEKFIEQSNIFNIIKDSKLSLEENNKKKKELPILDHINVNEKINILLCEDNNFNIKLIEKILFDSPYKDYISLDIAYNGKIGGDMIKRDLKKYDLILMDLQMPEMNGLETSEYIRKELKLTIPIIAMTANICSIEKEKCLNTGINEYFTKPFNKKEFFDCFNIILKDKIVKIKDKNISKINSNLCLINESQNKNKGNEIYKESNINDKCISINETNLKDKHLEDINSQPSINIVTNGKKSEFIEKIKESKNNLKIFQSIINNEKPKINQFNPSLNLILKNETNILNCNFYPKSQKKTKNNFPNIKTFKKENNENFNKLKNKQLLIKTEDQNKYLNNTDSNKKNFYKKIIELQNLIGVSNDKENIKYKNPKYFILNFENNLNTKNINFINNYSNFNFNGNNQKKENSCVNKFYFLNEKVNQIKIEHSGKFQNSIENFFKISDKKIPIIYNRLKNNETHRLFNHGINFENDYLDSNYFLSENKINSKNIFINRNKEKILKIRNFTKNIDEKLTLKKSQNFNNRIEKENKDDYRNNYVFNVENYYNHNSSKIKQNLTDIGMTINSEDLYPFIKDKNMSKYYKSIQNNFSNDNKSIMYKRDYKCKKIENQNFESNDKFILKENIKDNEANNEKEIQTKNIIENHKNSNINDKFFNFSIGKIKNFENILSEFRIDLQKEQINFDVFREYTGEDKESKIEIIESFKKEFPILIDEFENSLNIKDWQEISKTCHKMKSPIALFGLNILRDNLIKIEEFCKFTNKNFESMKNNIPYLRSFLDKIYKDLKNYISFV